MANWIKLCKAFLSRPFAQNLFSVHVYVVQIWNRSILQLHGNMQQTEVGKIDVNHLYLPGNNWKYEHIYAKCVFAVRSGSYMFFFLPTSQQGVIRNDFFF